MARLGSMVRRTITLCVALLVLNVAIANSQDGAKRPASAPVTSTPAPDASASDDLIIVKALDFYLAARAEREAKNLVAARAKAAEGIDVLVGADARDDDSARATMLFKIACFAFDVGELRAADRGFARALEFRERTLPEDDADVQLARAKLARARKSLGDLHGALALEERVLEIDTKRLAEEHPDLQAARGNLAVTLYSLGDVRRAQDLLKQNLANGVKSLPDDHPQLQATRANLAATMKACGDLEGALALEEMVLAIDSRNLPEDDRNLQAARQNLAITKRTLGDLPGARKLQEQSLAALAAQFPDDHPDILASRLNLAGTMRLLGDIQGARALQEQVLAIRLKILPDDHPDLQATRGNLALTLKSIGDLRGARVLQEEVLAVFARTFPDDSLELQRARGNLALTMRELGDLEGTKKLEEQVLSVCSRTLPDTHPELQTARLNLAVTLHYLGEYERALALDEQVYATRMRVFPDDHPELQTARSDLVVTLATKIATGERAGGAKERCTSLVSELARAETHAGRTAIVGGSSREAEERCASLAESLNLVLSFGRGFGVFERTPTLDEQAFVLSETTRGAALASAAIRRLAAGSPRYAELRDDLARASQSLADLARAGATADAFDAARTMRDAAERELIDAAHALGGGAVGVLDFDLMPFARQLGPKCAAIAFRCFTDWQIEVVANGGPARTREMEGRRLCAFVVRGGGAVDANSTQITLVDLGPIGPIEQAIDLRRDAIGVGRLRGRPAQADTPEPSRESADRLRALIFDPLLPALGDANRLIVVLDDVLHLVPIDALPLADGSGSLGDRFRIDTRATLTELLDAVPRPSEGVLLGVGGVDFDASPAVLSASDRSETAPRPREVAAVLRGGPSAGGFEPLPHTALEVRGIAARFAEAYGADANAVVLENREASRASLEELSPKARFLHVATHGWFAPESISSFTDPAPPGSPTGSIQERVRGMSPMLLCGLALTGANLPEDEVGRAPGLLTAEEIAAFDLSRCDLAVLSACDTNIGIRRAGQGVASLQRALQMAGARSVITSLWKVRDEPTKDLMLDFYRRLWIEKKPKHQSLWEAKKKLRDAVDEHGRPLYSTRDWAAWVLTGNPD